jgi:putative acetyltransferase
MSQNGNVISTRRLQDDDAIDALLLAAFKGDGEAKLVRALRDDGDMTAEFVTRDRGGRVIAHVAFSALDVRSGEEAVKAAALAPLSVLPEHQRRGVGDDLTRHALSQLRDGGVELVVVLGHPAYYPRFGFSELLARLLDAPYSGSSFMALELVPKVLGQTRWHVKYAPAFSRS